MTNDTLHVLKNLCYLTLKMFWGGSDPEGKSSETKPPKGIMNVVRWDDSGVSGVCKNPELASNFVKIFAKPTVLMSVPQTEAGGVLVVHRTLLFSCVRSTQIITLSCGFGTTTIPEHQSVGYLTGTITPSCLILSNSALNLGKRDTGTWCSAVNAKGFAPSFI